MHSADGRSSDSQRAEGSFRHAKPPEGLSPATYYQDPSRQQRQRRWVVARFILNSVLWCAALLLFIVDLILISWFGYSFDELGGHTIWAASCSLVWTSAECIVLLWRRSLSRGIDVRWHLSIHLILWCGCAVNAGITSFMISYIPARLYRSGELEPYKWWLLRNRFIIIMSLLGLLMILHFVLFVRDCVEVNRTNHEKQVTRVFRALAQLNPSENDSAVAPPPPAVLQGTGATEAANWQVQQSKPAGELGTPLVDLPPIPRRPVGGPESIPPADTAPGSYRILDPDVEANLKFMGPLPVESIAANHKYPSRILGAKRVEREVAMYPEAAIRRLSL